jgi:hypothetical protein
MNNIIDNTINENTKKRHIEKNNDINEIAVNDLQFNVGKKSKTKKKKFQQI